MIKINLLPRKINEKKVVRDTAILFGVLVVAVVLIGVLYTQLFMVPQVQAQEKSATDAETLEAEVVGIEKQVSDWKSTKIPPVQKKLTFIKDVLDYNLKYPRLYEEIAKWTYEKVAYMGMGSNGTEVVMAARTKNLDYLGRYLLNMYRATDLFTEVTISGVPGYPTGGGSFGSGGFQAPGISGGGGPEANLSGIGAISTGVQNAPSDGYIGFTVTCKLKTPIVAPTFAGAQAATDTAGAPGMPPSMPSMPSPGMPGQPMTP